MMVMMTMMEVTTTTSMTIDNGWEGEGSVFPLTDQEVDYDEGR